MSGPGRPGNYGPGEELTLQAAIDEAEAVRRFLMRYHDNVRICAEAQGKPGNYGPGGPGEPVDQALPWLCEECGQPSQTGGLHPSCMGFRQWINDFAVHWNG